MRRLKICKTLIPYDDIREGLGFEFFEAIQNELIRLENFPHFQKVYGKVRRVTNKRFRYNIYYYVEEFPHSKTIVIAFMHGSRDKSNWQNRVN